MFFFAAAAFCVLRTSGAGSAAGKCHEESSALQARAFGGHRKTGPGCPAVLKGKRKRALPQKDCKDECSKSCEIIKQKNKGCANFCRAGGNPFDAEQCATGRQPTKVFFLLGQSNMEGHGIAELPDDELIDDGTLPSPQNDGTLVYALRHKPNEGLPIRDFKWMAENREECIPSGVNIDDTVCLPVPLQSPPEWKQWPSVRVNYFGKIKREWAMVHPEGPLSVGYGVGNATHSKKDRDLGPELGFGIEMAKYYGTLPESPDVLLIKVAWGGTSLAVDWRPPSSVNISGGEVGWVYTSFIDRAHHVLNNLGKSYEISGMVWHQGHGDKQSPLIEEYAANLVNFIKDVRTEFNASEMKVTIPISGQIGWTGPNGKQKSTPPDMLAVVKAQYEVAQLSSMDDGDAPKTVAVPETRGFRRLEPACDEGEHYDCNAETYFYIGAVAGQSMVDLLKGKWDQPVIDTEEDPYCKGGACKTE